MKRLLNLLMLPLYMAMLAACGQADPDLPQDSSTSTSIQSDADSTPKESTDTAALPHEDPSPINTTQEESPMNATKKLRFLADGREIIVVLEDHAAADALYQQLPMELSFEDFNGTEKIAYLDQELPTDNVPTSCDPDAGHLCYYIPWGNLCFFYQDFKASTSLIPVGQVESGFEFLKTLDTASIVTVEAVH